jgi:HEAT repeat protein
MYEDDLELLDSPDEDIRCAALVRLADRDVNWILEPLLLILADPSWRVRKAAIKALEKADKHRLIPLLLKALREDHAGVRNAAMECLINIGKEAVGPLCQLLSDPDKDLRIFAVNTLGAIRDPTAYPCLIKALTDPEKNVCHAAIDALAKVKDPRAVDPLIQIVQREDIWLKLPAISTLGELGDPRAIPYLLPLAQDFLFKQTVIEALGAIGDEAGIPLAIPNLEDPDPDIQKTALLALKKILFKADRINRMMDEITPLRQQFNQAFTSGALNYLLRAAEDENPEIAEAAISLLGWSEAPEATETLLKLLNHERLSESAMEALLNQGTRILSGLEEQYEFNEYNQKLRILECLNRLSWNLLSDLEEKEPISMDSGVRFGENFESVEGIVSEGYSQGLKDVLKVLQIFIDLFKKEGEEELQAEILRGLASERFIKFLRLQTISTLPLFRELLVLIEEALQSQDAFLRAEAIKLIGQLKGATALNLLHLATKDLDGRVRAAAITQLGWLARRDSGLLDSVTLALSDEDPKVREQAALALGSIPEPKAFEALLQAIQDEDFRVKRAVIRTLGKFKNLRIIDTLAGILPYCKRREDGTLRVAICETLGQFLNSEKSITLLSEMLTDYDFVVRRAAVYALGNAKDYPEHVKGFLIKALEDPHWSVQEAAIKCLGKLGVKDCEDLFLHLLNHPKIGLQKAAIQALGEIGSEKALEMLIPLLVDEGLCEEAYQALLIWIDKNDRSDVLTLLVEEKGRSHPNPLVYRLVKSILNKGNHGRSQSRSL